MLVIHRYPQDIASVGNPIADQPSMDAKQALAATGGDMRSPNTSRRCGGWCPGLSPAPPPGHAATASAMGLLNDRL